MCPSSTHGRRSAGGASSAKGRSGACAERYRSAVMAWQRSAVRRAALDWLAPLIVLGIGVVNVTMHPDSPSYPGSPAIQLTFLTASVAALGLRRRAPILAPLLAIVIVTV